MNDLFSKEHPILEREFMEHQPFGIGADGQRILDVSGATVAANVCYLEEVLEKSQGKEAGIAMSDLLCRLVNERIPDAAYHVTPAFLKNTWNSYSYEFVCFLGEFCKLLSGDPFFQFKVGKEKFISPLIMTLGRPFSISQIYRMFASFGDKFAKGSLHFEVATVTSSSAILRLRLSERIYKQFGPYRMACAYLICQSAKGALIDIPERFQKLPAATIIDRSCIANGEDTCEWEISWKQPAASFSYLPIAEALAGAATFWYLYSWQPSLSVLPSFLLSLLPAIAVGLARINWKFHKTAKEKEHLLQEQIRFGDARYEELREAFLERQQMTIDLRRRIGELTMLQKVGLIFNSTLDREVLLRRVLQATIDHLHYDRAMISFYDAVRNISYDSRIIGVSNDISAYVRSIEVPITDMNSLEGEVLLQGRAVLVNDLRKMADRLHPLNQKLMLMSEATSLISVPLMAKNRVIGALTVDRRGEHRLAKDDLDVISTMAGQVAIALDNADVYSKLEEVNLHLEDKVRDRTVALETLNADLEAANEKLRDADSLKTLFISIVSHELRTPMTSIKGYVDNALEGIAGELSGKQIYYMTRIKHNVERLLRMTRDLLDLSRIEAGKLELHPQSISMPQLINDVIEGFAAIACEKSICIEARHEEEQPMILGDRDKLCQVLTILVDNALKFTQDGGAVRITSAGHKPGLMEFCVADNGCGILAHEIEKVFDKFYRGESVRSDSRGAGLGLALAKDLIRLHGGDIWVTSEVGKGSEFYFTLPIQEEDHSIDHYDR